MTIKNLILALLFFPVLVSGQISSARKLLLMQTAECPVCLDNGGLQYTDSTIGNITVNYPATVNQGDDLILVVFSAENSNTINAISGWNTIEINTGDAADGYAVFYKSAEGNEDGGTVVVDISNSGYGVFFGAIIRFSGANSYSSVTSGEAFVSSISSLGISRSYSNNELGVGLLMFTGTGYNIVTGTGYTTFSQNVEISNSNQGGGKLMIQSGCNGSYRTGFGSYNIRNCAKTIILSN